MLDVNWGPTTHGAIFNSALNNAYKLTYIPDHVKNYRPSIVALVGNPSAREALVDFAASLTSFSLLQLAHICRGPIDFSVRAEAIEKQQAWMKRRKIKGFYVLCEAESIQKGLKQIVQVG